MEKAREILNGRGLHSELAFGGNYSPRIIFHLHSSMKLKHFLAEMKTTMLQLGCRKQMLPCFDSVRHVAIERTFPQHSSDRLD